MMCQRQDAEHTAKRMPKPDGTQDPCLWQGYRDLWREGWRLAGLSPATAKHNAASQWANSAVLSSAVSAANAPIHLRLPSSFRTHVEERNPSMSSPSSLNLNDRRRHLASFCARDIEVLQHSLMYPLALSLLL